MVEADRRSSVAVDPQVLPIDGRPAPPLALSASLQPSGDAYRVELTLENRGSRPLTEIRARLAHPDDERIELLDREVGVAYLRPDTPERLDIGIDVPQDYVGPDADPLLLHLRVEAELYGTVLEVPVTVPGDGEVVALTGPRISGDLPVALPVGSWPLVVRAEDDRAVTELAAWSGRHKVVWTDGSGDQLTAEIPLEIGSGTQSVTVLAVDDQGVETVRRWYVRGLPADTLDDAAEASHSGD